jgi:hypothetical protein
LKQTESANFPLGNDQFRDHVIAASLKLELCTFAMEAIKSIPRSRDRGLIEASRRSFAASPASLKQNVRVDDGGLIEATLIQGFWKGLIEAVAVGLKKPSAVGIPRSRDRGLIEA